MPQTLASLLGLIVIFAVCGLTGIVGGSRERGAAVATAGGTAASIGIQHVSAVWDPVWLLGAVDFAVLLVLVALAWRPRRGWPLWAVGFQGLTVAIDVLRAAALTMAPYTYLTAIALSTYGLAAVIAYAGISAWRSRR